MSSDNTSAATAPVIFSVIAGVLVQNAGKIMPMLKNLAQWIALTIGSGLLIVLVTTLLGALLCSLCEGVKNMIKEYFRKKEEEKAYFEEKLSTVLREASRKDRRCDFVLSNFDYHHASRVLKRAAKEAGSFGGRYRDS